MGGTKSGRITKFVASEERDPWYIRTRNVAGAAALSVFSAGGLTIVGINNEWNLVYNPVRTIVEETVDDTIGDVRESIADIVASRDIELTEDVTYYYLECVGEDDFARPQTAYTRSELSACSPDTALSAAEHRNFRSPDLLLKLYEADGVNDSTTPWRITAVNVEKLATLGAVPTPTPGPTEPLQEEARQCLAAASRVANHYVPGCNPEDIRSIYRIRATRVAVLDRD